MSTASSMALLCDGREAFPSLLCAIGAATESIDINMFLWRDDVIGNRMAEALLAAADRGVRVRISVDRYAAVLEYSEECRRSFFHKSISRREMLTARFLTRFYRQPNTLPPQKQIISELYARIVSHPGITVDADRHKADHSKFYIIDGRILFLGGINVEDKENGADRQGRVYGDYMVRLEGEEYVRAFLRKQRTGSDDPALPLFFPMNLRSAGLCEMREHYLSLLREARTEITVVMSYFSPIRLFTEELIAAAGRGVRVRILIPGSANFQDDSNKRTARRLLCGSGGAIEVYLSEKMLHTKLVLTDRAVSLGSTNITKKAFSQLDELNLCVHRDDSSFFHALTKSIEGELAKARHVTEKELGYRRAKAFLERFIV